MNEETRGFQPHFENESQNIDYTQLLSEAEIELSKQDPENSFANKAEVAAKKFFDSTPNLDPKIRYELVYTLAKQPGFKRATGRQGATNRYFPSGTDYRTTMVGYDQNDKPIYERGASFGPSTGWDSLDSRYWNRKGIVAPEPTDTGYLQRLKLINELSISLHRDDPLYLPSVNFLKRLESLPSLNLRLSIEAAKRFIRIVANINIALLNNYVYDVQSRNSADEAELKKDLDTILGNSDPRVENLGLCLEEGRRDQPIKQEGFNRNTQLEQLQKHFEGMGLVSDEYWDETRGRINLSHFGRPPELGYSNSFYDQIRELLKQGAFSRVGHPLAEDFGSEINEQLEGTVKHELRTQKARAIQDDLIILRSLIAEFIPDTVLESLNKRTSRSPFDAYRYLSLVEEGQRLMSWFVNQDIRKKIASIPHDDDQVKIVTSDIIQQSLATLSDDDKNDLLRLQQNWLDDTTDKNFRAKLLRAVIYYGSKAKLRKGALVELTDKTVLLSLEDTSSMAKDQLPESERPESERPESQAIDVQETNIKTPSDIHVTETITQNKIEKFKKKYEIKSLMEAKNYAEKFKQSEGQTESISEAYKREGNPYRRLRMAMGLLELNLNGLEQLLFINDGNTDGKQPIDDYFMLLDTIKNELLKYESTLAQADELRISDQIKQLIIDVENAKRQLDLFKAVIQFQQLSEVQEMYKDEEYIPKIIRSIVYHLVSQKYNSGDFPADIIQEGNLEAYMRSLYEAVEEEYILKYIS